MTTIDKANGVLIRVFDEDIARWKKEYPNLVGMWALTDGEILQIIAADTMKQTFASRPAKWHVQPRELCDDAVLGWRVGILTEDQLPLGSK